MWTGSGGGFIFSKKSTCVLVCNPSTYFHKGREDQKSPKNAPQEICENTPSYKSHFLTSFCTFFSGRTLCVMVCTSSGGWYGILYSLVSGTEMLEKTNKVEMRKSFVTTAAAYFPSSSMRMCGGLLVLE